MEKEVLVTIDTIATVSIPIWVTVIIKEGVKVAFSQAEVAFSVVDKKCATKANRCYAILVGEVRRLLGAMCCN